LKPIEIHSQAFQEIEEAKRWYEQNAKGLGDQFIEQIERAMERVREFPEAWPV
jgi:hypothetical protein